MEKDDEFTLEDCGQFPLDLRFCFVSEHPKDSGEYYLYIQTKSKKYHSQAFRVKLEDLKIGILELGKNGKI